MRLECDVSRDDASERRQRAFVALGLVVLVLFSAGSPAVVVNVVVGGGGGGGGGGAVGVGICRYR